MDIKKHIYFFATSVKTTSAGRHFILGCGFEMIASESTDPFLREPYQVAREQAGPLPVSLDLCHINSKGWHLEIDQPQQLSLPCLLTSDREIGWTYSGSVSVELPPEITDTEETFDRPTALVGHDWIGVLNRHSSGNWWLDAFSHAPLKRDAVWEAYNLDWDEGFDDDTNLFKISPE